MHYSGTNSNATTRGAAQVLVARDLSFDYLWCRLAGTTTTAITTFTLEVTNPAGVTSDVGGLCTIGVGQTGPFSASGPYVIAAGSLIDVRINSTSATSDSVYWGLSNLAGTVAPNDFSIALTPSTRSVSSGGATTTYTINTTLLGGSAETVSLSVLTNCATFFASCTLTAPSSSGTPASISSLSGSSTLTVTTNVGGTTPTGSQSIVVRGTAPSITHDAAAVTLTVTTPPFAGNSNGSDIWPNNSGTPVYCSAVTAVTCLTAPTTNGNSTPAATTVTGFTVTLGAAPTGSTATLTVSLMRAGVAVMSCTILAPSATSCTATGSVTFSGAQTMNLRFDRTSGGDTNAATVTASWTIDHTP